eukprot:1270897-Prymnesium_polylepis.1
MVHGLFERDGNYVQSAPDALQSGVNLEHLAQCRDAFHVATRADVIASKTVQQGRQTVMGP